MYTVRLNYDKNLIHDPSIGLFLTNPHLVMEENCAGSFEFDMPPDHPQINAVKRLKCEISVYRDGEEIWAGRPVEETTNFYGVKHVYCEGLLSALFDTTQPPSERHDTSVIDFMDAMLKIHNSQVTPTYRWRPFFRAGIVTVKENLYRYTNFEETLTCINEKLVKRLGGHLRMRRKNGNDPYNFLLDYLKDYPTQSTQVIRFGQNLLDYSKNFDASGLATVIVPLGARQEEKDIEALEKYLDVASVNGGSVYVQDDALVELYGKIVKVAHWDDVTTAKELLKKAKLYLSKMQYENMQLEVKAVDFHLADENVPAINLLDEIRVVSAPHGLDKFFPVTKLDIQLDQPENTLITLGTVVKTSLTTQTNDRSNEIKALVDSYVPPSEILTQAKNQAAQLIESGALGGHVVVLPNEIYISDSDDISTAEKQWRWNLKGLGYRSKKGGSFGLAMTMDGSIVADYITSGLMSADRIRGGSLKLGGGSYKNGVLYMYNASSKEIGRWDKNGLTVTKGTISGSVITVGGKDNASGRLRIVDEKNEVIGSWNSTGIHVLKGGINGANITVGGQNNQSGVFRITNASNNVIGKWDKDGIVVRSGSIKGTTIQGNDIIVGGSKNVNGAFTVLDSKGNETGRWDKDGLNVKSGTIKGTTISGGSITGTNISASTFEVKGNAKIAFYDTSDKEVGAIDKSGFYYGYYTDEHSTIRFDGTSINAKDGITLTGKRTLEIYEDEYESGSVKIVSGIKGIDFYVNNTFAYGDKKYERHGRIMLDDIEVDGFNSIAQFVIQATSRLILKAPNVCFSGGDVSILSGSTVYSGQSSTITINSKRLRFMKGLLVEVTDV